MWSSVGTGRARLLGFWVGFGGQNPSLATLRLSGFGPFRALGFFGLFQAFLVHVQHQVGLFISSCLSWMLFHSFISSSIPRFISIKSLSRVYNLTMLMKPTLTPSNPPSWITNPHNGDNLHNAVKHQPHHLKMFLTSYNAYLCNIHFVILLYHVPGFRVK